MAESVGPGWASMLPSYSPSHSTSQNIHPGKSPLWIQPRDLEGDEGPEDEGFGDEV